MSYRALHSPGLLSQHYRPPLLPKPGKDNARLQKLLKKSAKKKAAQQAAQQVAIPYRRLSPVNEASPDLEHSDHSTPPKTPETPLYSATLHPRYNIKPLYQHVSSPYPHHRVFTYPTATRFSPQPYAAPSQQVARSMTPQISYTPPPRPAGASPLPGPGTYAEAHMLFGGAPTYPMPYIPPAPAPAPAAVHIPVSVPVPAPAPDPLPAPGPGLAPVPEVAPVAFAAPAPAMPTAPVQTVEPSNKLLIPITVVAQKTPSPRFHVFDVTKPARPMFEVPQITIYTAKTSYYETETAPLHDTSSGRLFYGRSPSPRARSRSPTPDPRRGPSPTRLLAPRSNSRGGGMSPSPSERGRTLHVKRGATPTSDVRGRTTPVIEITTPTADLRGAAAAAPPPSDPTKEYMEGRRSKTPTQLSVSEEVSPKPLEPEQPKVSAPSNDVQVKAQVTSIPMVPTEIPSKPEATLPQPSVKEAIEPSPLTTTPVPATSVTSAIPQKPITSPQEAPKLSTANTGQAETKADATALTVPGGVPKPTSAQSQAQSLKPIFGQRPRTPIHGGMKSTPRTYYGLTPSAYVAHGGIQTIAPSFSVSRPKTPTTESLKPEEKIVAEKETPVQEVPKPVVPTEQKPSAYVAHGGIQTIAPSFSVSRPKTPTTESPKAEEKIVAEKETPLQEVPKPVVPIEQKPKATVAEIPAEINSSTETKASVHEKPQQATQPSASKETKTKPVPVPVVEQTKPQVTEVKESTSPATSAVPKPSATETLKAKAAISGPPAPETPKAKAAISGPPAPKTTSETKTVTAQTQKIAAMFSKAKTSEKGSDETKKQDDISTPVKEQTEVPKEPVKPKGTALEASKLIGFVVNSKPKVSEKPEADKTEAQPVAKPKDKSTEEEVKSNKEEKKSDAQAGEPNSTAAKEEKKEKEDGTLPKAESLLKVMQKPKGLKSKLSGWSRLKKHMVVEVEEPKFPEGKPDSATEATTKKDMSNGAVPTTAAKTTTGKEEAPASGEQTEGDDAPRATMMWDAVLFQMFSSKENIMQQIMADKTEEEKKEMEEKAADKSLEIPSFAHRLPVLLFSPKFDAKRLREAASRPVTKMSTVFEMGLIGRKNKDEEPKQFNRTARGFSSSKSSEA
ncbi:proteoglycan 4 isoform X2 [Engraulis encrasicolus]|uniref:proteoglycan 4 isoform X2 n=1 Tax=Engraulis encrasicolus TaxID=184585 RepID=UPI002FD40CE0